MPRLTELDAHFLRYEERVETWNKIVGDQDTWRARGCPVEPFTAPRACWHHVATLAEADGIMFLCPKCYAANNGPIGTHSVVCWFRGKVPDSADPKPGRWTPQGSGLEDLTFVPGTPPMATSVILTGGGCAWHGFVNNGDAT